MKRPPLKLFFSYAHEDQGVRDELDKHLDVLEREGLITVWWDGEITAGSRWSEAIENHLRASDIIIFLISPRFFKSAFIMENELPIALELEKESEGQKRVISVLTERTNAFNESELSQMQRVPSGDLPLSECEDRIQAFYQVVVEIRRAVMRIIIEAGGPFEFGSHAFTHAELAQLEPKLRKRTSEGLRRLRSSLVRSVPKRRLDKNLLVASWCLDRLANPRQTIESLYYLAQVVSAFDVVSLQKVARNLNGLRSLIAILGPEWGFVITDITLGTVGANERFAILYYRPRVTFDNISGSIVLPADSLIDGQQFARTPLLASFSSGNVRFRVCSAHIRYGYDSRLRTAECETLSNFLSRIAERDKEEILLTGDFNLLRDDTPVLEIFRKHGVDIPPETVHPTLWISGKLCDLIGHLHGDAEHPRKLTVSRSTMVGIFDSVFRDEDFEQYEEAIQAQISGMDGNSDRARFSAYKDWKKHQISDHLPVWVEYEIGA